MCGIVGFTGEKMKDIDIKEIMSILSHRGEDSFGCILVSNKTITTVRTMTVAALVKWLKGISIKNKDFLLFHNRKASIGGVNLNLAHPITKGDVTVIHNGTKKILHTEFTNLGKSDTEVITQLISENFVVNSITEWLLKDTGVVFALNKNGKLLFHTDNSRPLFVNKERDIVCSEPIFIGDWELTINQDIIFDNFEDFRKNAETFAKTVAIKDEKIMLNYCDACGKEHYTPVTDDTCFSCSIQGKVARTYYYNRGLYGAKTKAKTKAKIQFNFKVGEIYGNGDGEEITITGTKHKGNYPIGGCGNDGAKYNFTKDGQYIKQGYSKKDLIKKVSGGTLSKRNSTDTLLKGRSYLFSNDGKNWAMLKATSNQPTSSMYFSVKVKDKHYAAFTKYREITKSEHKLLQKCTIKVGDTYWFSNSINDVGETSELFALGFTSDGELIYFTTYNHSYKYVSKSVSKKEAQC